MLRAILYKPWKQHLTKQLYGYLFPISKTIQVGLTSHVWHCWRSKDEFISDVHLHLDVPVLADQQELIYITALEVPVV